MQPAPPQRALKTGGVGHSSKGKRRRTQYHGNPRRRLGVVGYVADGGLRRFRAHQYPKLHPSSKPKSGREPMVPTHKANIWGRPRACRRCPFSLPRAAALLAQQRRPPSSSSLGRSALFGIARSPPDRRISIDRSRDTDGVCLAVCPPRLTFVDGLIESQILLPPTTHNTQAASHSRASVGRSRRGETPSHRAIQSHRDI